MSEEMREKKTYFITGDVVEFVLSPVATFTKGNYFVGTIMKVLPKKFSVIVKPSEQATKKLQGMMGSENLIVLQFRCCRIKSLKTHKALVALRKREKIERKRQQFIDSTEALKNRFSGPKNEKKPKEKKPNKNWSWKPSK